MEIRDEALEVLINKEKSIFPFSRVVGIILFLICCDRCMAYSFCYEFF